MVKYYVLLQADIGTIGTSQITVQCVRETLLTPTEVALLMKEAKDKTSAVVKKQTEISVPISMIRIRFIGFAF